MNEKNEVPKTIYKLTREVYIEAGSPGEARFILQKILSDKIDDITHVKNAENWRVESSSLVEYEQSVP